MTLGKTICAVLAVLGLCALSPVTNAMGNQDPGIMPIHSNPHGMSYGEWGAAWWQWVDSQPADVNPLTDETGEHCGQGQSGSVWFLAGAPGFGEFERACTIPTGRAIFFPVYNWLLGAGVFDCEPTTPGVECDVQELMDFAAVQTELAENEGASLEVWIDGEPVEDVLGHRAASPEAFALTLPDDNIVGVPSGTYYPNVSDGYWLFLPPPAAGEHIIEISVSVPGTALGLFEFSVTHALTVEPGPP